jgi:hypothetical protein
MNSDDADTVVDQLRDHIADVHGADCDRRTVPCTCHYEKRAEELIREAAARIEVAIEALQGSDNRPPSIQAALYALTAERPAP